MFEEEDYVLIDPQEVARSSTTIIDETEMASGTTPPVRTVMKRARTRGARPTLVVVLSSPLATDGEEEVPFGNFVEDVMEQMKYLGVGTTRANKNETTVSSLVDDVTECHTLINKTLKNLKASSNLNDEAFQDIASVFARLLYEIDKVCRTDEKEGSAAKKKQQDSKLALLQQELHKYKTKVLFPLRLEETISTYTRATIKAIQDKMDASVAAEHNDPTLRKSLLWGSSRMGLFWRMGALVFLLLGVTLANFDVWHKLHKDEHPVCPNQQDLVGSNNDCFVCENQAIFEEPQEEEEEDAEETNRPRSILQEHRTLFGRENELKQLNETLGQHEGTMASLVGGAGLGKSHLASSFAQKWRKDDSVHRFVFWIVAATETSIRVSYMQVLKRLGITLENQEDDDISTSDLAHRVWVGLGHVSSEFEWMLVFDNVPSIENDDSALAFSHWFFPTPLENWGRGRILFTTRSEAFSGPNCLGFLTPVHVNPLPRDAAIKMLVANVVGHENEAAAEELAVAHFGGLPLAIATASGQMVSSGATVQGYLEELKSGLSDGVRDAVTVTLDNAIAHARQNGLGDLLDVVAFVSPDRIPLELIGNDRCGAMRLCAMGLLHRVGGNVYSMHRLHQEAARKDCLATKAIKAVDDVLSGVELEDSSASGFATSMLPHAGALIRHVEAMEDSSPLAEPDVIRYTRIVQVSAKVLQDVSYDFHGACAQYEKAVELIRLHGADATKADLEGSLSELADLYRALGSYEHSVVLYDEALRLKRERLGANAVSLELASMVNNLGNVHHNLGNYDLAIANYEAALDMKRRIYGADANNLEVASTVHSLALLYNDLSKYETALAMYEKSLRMKREIYGENAKNADLGATLASIGILYQNLGLYDDALAKFQDALAMTYHVHGTESNNPDVARILNDIGLLYNDIGKLDESLINFERALEIFRLVYGKDGMNLDIAKTLHNLGLLYSDLGSRDDAYNYYEAALDMKRTVYGDGAMNTDLAATINNLGFLLSEMGFLEDALVLYEECLQMKRHVYGSMAKNTDLGITYNNYGSVQRDLAHYNDALVSFQTALEMYQAVYGADGTNTDVALTLESIGSLHRTLGNYEEAEAHYLAALEMYRAVYGEHAKNSDLAGALNSLGILYKKLGNYDLAIAKYKAALDMMRHEYGPGSKNDHLASILYNLGSLYADLNDHENAIAAYKEGLDMMRHVYGKDAMNDDLAGTIETLGILYKSQGNNEESISCYEECLRIKRHIYGPDASNGDLASILYTVGNLYLKLGDNVNARHRFQQALEMFSHGVSDKTSRENQWAMQIRKKLDKLKSYE